MEDTPLIRVTRGNPTAEEIAALAGVLLTRSRRPTVTVSRTPSAWTRSGRPTGATGAGMPFPPGPGTWRQSGLPR